MNPILASFLLYFVFITFPLIPAILIYKIFPDTQVGAKGLMGNLKINATGAFAAYIVTSVMSFFVVQYVQDMIRTNNEQSWTINSSIIFLDADGKPIEKDIQKLVDMTQIYIKPDPFINKTPDLIKFNVMAKGNDFIVSFQQKNFMGPTFDLSQADSSIKIDYKKRSIQLGKVVMKQIQKDYTSGNKTIAEHVDGEDAPPTE